MSNVRRAGDVIPEIVKVIFKKKESDKVTVFEYAKSKCPVCNSKLLKDEDGAVLRCQNGSILQCSKKTRINAFLLKKGNGYRWSRRKNCWISLYKKNLLINFQIYTNLKKNQLM